MLNEDQYLDRTPDLVAKVRKIREAAEKEMNRFTRVADYDVRRVIGYGPKRAPASNEIVPAKPVGERPRKSPAKSTSTQTVLEFTPTPSDDDGENI